MTLYMLAHCWNVICEPDQQIDIDSLEAKKSNQLVTAMGPLIQALRQPSGSEVRHKMAAILGLALEATRTPEVRELAGKYRTEINLISRFDAVSRHLRALWYSVAMRQQAIEHVRSQQSLQVDEPVNEAAAQFLRRAIAGNADFPMMAI